MDWKSNPRLFSFAVISCAKAENVALMPFQISVIAVRNSSFVFQRFINAATSVPMTATAATTGAEMPPKAAPSFPNNPDALPTFDASADTPFANDEKPFSAAPVFEITVPKITSSGPIAVTTAPIFTIVSFVSVSRLEKAVAHSWIFATIARTVGMRMSLIWMAIPSIVDFRMVIWPDRLSSLMSAASFAAPSAS